MLEQYKRAYNYNKKERMKHTHYALDQALLLPT
jgi:hypothetical protein